MYEILTLLKPRIWPLVNRSSRKGNRGSIVKLSFLGFIGLFFWGAIFAVAIRVLTYFKSIEEIGDILGYKLLSMILIVSFVMPSKYLSCSDLAFKSKTKYSLIF